MLGFGRMTGDKPKAMRDIGEAWRRSSRPNPRIPLGSRRDGRLPSPPALAVGSATACGRRLDPRPSGRDAARNDYVNRA